MHVILISDIHLASSTDNTFGVDTKANFERVIARIKAHQPAHVVMMGDYSLKAPRREDVVFASAKLKTLGLPYSFIAGNHDDSTTLADVLDDQTSLLEGGYYYSKELSGHTCLFLDTSKGFVSARQRAWIATTLSRAKGQVHIFMHHPPIAMGVPFMDASHQLQDSDKELYEVLFARDVPVHIYSGHYHTARSAQVGIHSVHLCPSTYFQLDPNHTSFQVSHTMPGIRHFEIQGNELRTWVEFLPKSM